MQRQRAAVRSGFGVCVLNALQLLDTIPKRLQAHRRQDATVRCRVDQRAVHRLIPYSPRDEERVASDWRVVGFAACGEGRPIFEAFHPLQPAEGADCARIRQRELEV